MTNNRRSSSRARRMGVNDSEKSAGMTRGRFLRTVGVGATTFGATALGLGGTAKAQGVEYDVPTPPKLPQGMEDGFARNADGSSRYLLSVTADFHPEDVEGVGGVVEWSWPEAGVAAVSSNSEAFVNDALSISSVNYAILEPLLRVDTASIVQENSNAMPPIQDAYNSNLQWNLQAVGAVRYENGNTPVWQLPDGYDGHGVTVGILDSGTPAMWLQYIPNIPSPLDPNTTYDKVLDAKLHDEFDWYLPNDGGAMPMFTSLAEYQQYYSSHPDPRLPNPGALFWANELNPQPGPNNYIDGIPNNGYDMGGLRIIIDPLVGGLDGLAGGLDFQGFGSFGHGTVVAGPIGARHKSQLGRMRGLAPHATTISYNTMLFEIWQLPSKVLYAMMRATIDGCNVLSCSWGILTSKNALAFPPDYSGTFDLGKFKDLFYSVLGVLEQSNILVVEAAGNWGANLRDAHISDGGPLFLLPASYNKNVLLISGTAPRDYDPFAPDLTIYDPGNNKGTATEYWLQGYPPAPAMFQLQGAKFNLDRPGVFGYPIFTTNYGKQTEAIELAAPSGSADPMMPNLFNAFYTTSPKDTTPGIMSGNYHEWGRGTSFAAPTTAAIAALAIQAYAGAHGAPPTIDVLKSILISSADPGKNIAPKTDVIYNWEGQDFLNDLLTSNISVWNLRNLQDIKYNLDKSGKSDFYGYGRVNVKKAIEEAQK